MFLPLEGGRVVQCDVLVLKGNENSSSESSC